MAKPPEQDISENSLVDPRNARTEEYRQAMEQIVAEKVCPLCPPMKWHPNPILNEDDRCLITETSVPYPNSVHHLLIIPKRHIELLPELLPEDLMSLLELAKWATREYDISGGGLVMRFGDTLYTGATIKHLHAHLIVPTVENGQVSPVYFPIG